MVQGLLGHDSKQYTNLLRACLNQCKQIKTHLPSDEKRHLVNQVLKTAKVIHANSLKVGIGKKGLLGNATVDLYSKCGDVDYSEKAFISLDKRDVFAWNSLLSMYSKLGHVQQILHSFRSLLKSGVPPNEFTNAMALSACSRLTDVEYGRQVHCCIIKMGFELSSFCQGALIDMYSKCNYLSDARLIFNVADEPDAVSWTAMIAGYFEAGFPEEAVRLFEKMQEVGCLPDQVTRVTVINAFVALRRLGDACKLFFQMPSPNVVAWNVLISGHSQKGYKQEAISLFLRMRKAGVKSTRSTLGSVLGAIAGLSALDYGLLVHAQAIKEGLDSNVYVGSALVNLYAKCERMDAAEKVFDSLSEKNAVLWNAMLGGYAQNGCPDEVMKLFSTMKQCGLSPDEFTYTSILSAFASLENLEMGRKLHAVIVKNNFASNLFVRNALIDMYAKSGALNEARKQFDLMHHRDNVSWNAIIVGYVQEENEREAFVLFNRMILEEILPDEVALASILSGCANIQALEQGRQVHCLSVKVGLGTGTYAGSSLIDMYAKCGAIGAAREVFSSMTLTTVVSMNALISGFAGGNFEEAIDLFQDMQAAGVKPTEVTFSILLDGCRDSAALKLGRQVHCLVLKWGFLYGVEIVDISLLGMYICSQSKEDASMLFSEIPNPKSKVVWTAIISGLAQNGYGDEALQFYQGMRSENVLPDQATFVSVLRACSLLSFLRFGRAIHSLIFHTGFNLDELTCSALVDMYAKCGDVERSTQVFMEMDRREDVISWNSMIVGFAKNGYAEQALEAFDEMKQSNVMPDDVTFLGILTACSHAGRVSEGRQVFDIMVNRYGILPRAEHLACMVDLLGRWGFLKEAEEFIDNLDFEPEPMIWTTLLGAARIHGDEARGRRAAEKLIQLKPQNSSSYLLLSNIYAASGNWKGAGSLRKEIKERGMKKLPGCSWMQ